MFAIRSAGDSVTIILEGSDDPENPYVYAFNPVAPSSDRFRGTDLTVRAAEGTYAAIDIGNNGSMGLNLLMDRWTQESDLVVSGIEFMSSTAGFAGLGVNGFWDATFEDCTFTVAYIHRSTNSGNNTDLGGSFTIRGCDFECTDAPYESYAVTFNSAYVVFEDNTVTNYARGINVGLREGETMGTSISGNSFTGINDDDGGFAIQISSNLEGATIDIRDNEIDDCLYALRVHDGCTGTPQSFDFNRNSITSTPNAILYSAKDGAVPQVSVNAENNYFAPDGRNGVALTVVTDAAGVSADSLVSAEEYYTNPSMQDVVTPPLVWDDDEDEESVVGGTTASEGRDDTVTVVACAAAAIVAALMAAFLILDRRP